ncbi:uncharacterized protein [Typha latifolia]|uniref:uncharacterized protein isoform X1 n=1 Tax=Typha latifolia TaxID=4733 RepID=UPI003C2E94F1
MGRNDPFWRTNTSFSPPLSRRWDYRFHSEGLSYGSQGDGGVANYGSSLSSNSKGSRSWERGDHPPNNTYSASEGPISYFSSPDGSFQEQQLTPPPVQGVNIGEFVRASEPPVFSLFMEGTSRLPYHGGSTSSHSDGSEGELMSKNHACAHHNLPSRRPFISKPIHPLSLPEHSFEGEGCSSVGTTSSSNTLRSDSWSFRALKGLQSPGPLGSAGHTRGESMQWSSASSVDFADVSDLFESESFGLSANNMYESTKCGLCERLLSQRSPWGSRRIVCSGDMPIAGVLSCCHVYHAECLDRTTPKTQRHDPPCPLCEKSLENFTEQWAVCRLKNGLPRLRSLGEEAPSRAWSCAQVGDCVERALHVPKASSALLLSRNRLKRHLSLKGNTGKDHRVENLKRSGFHSSHLFHGRVSGEHGAVGCSEKASCSTLKGW